MGEGPYSPEGFLRVWNAGNAFGIGAILSQRGDDPVWSLPSVQLHKAWHWNYTLAVRRARLGDAQYLPPIMYFGIAGQARTLAVWGEGMPAFLPRVDFVFIGRPQGDEKVFGLASRQQLTEILNSAGYQSGEDGFDLNYASVPQSIADFVAGIPEVDRSSLTWLTPDKVLDEELVVQAKAF